MTRRISFFAPGSIISEVALDTQVFAFNPKPARSASSALSGKKLASKPGKLAEIDNASNNNDDRFTHDDDVVAQGLIGQAFASQLAQLIVGDVIAAAVSIVNKSPAALTGSINQAAFTNNTIQSSVQSAKTLFVANDGINGPELWVTDGTTAGTTLLKDIVTGANGSNPYAITSLGNGKAIFSATDGISGIELWVSDGTTAGTVLLKDIYAGANSSYPNGYTALGNGKALFSANDGINGQELWITDGTAVGTSLLKTISAPASGITAIGNGKAVFQENDAINGQELWITDGTTAGTTLLKDINVGSLGSYASGFTTLGYGKVIFSATDGINGQELWITNGTTVGTTMLKDIYAGANIYGYAYSSSPAGFTVMGNGKIVFSASDGSHGEELWITDGTTAGTQLLKDIYAGAVDSLPTGFTALGNGKVIFIANDGINGQELWITDGTAAGTQLLKDIYAGAGSSSPSSFTALGNGKFLFIANDGISGQELWITDGTAAGTLLLKDIYPGAGDSMLLVNSIKVLGNGKATFSANDGINGQELWITDGTTAGTGLLKDINAVAGGSSPIGFTALGNGKDVFTARDASHGSELWITDGTTAGTALLKDIYAGVVDSSPAGFTALGNGKAIFSATDSISGQELWITDGTTIGTALLKDIYSGAVDSSPTGFTALGNGNVIFSATDDINGTELWITDGTTTGTTLLKDINAGIVDSYATGFTTLAIGKAIFSATDGINGQELWITDGTTAGTMLLKDINLGADSLLSSGFTALALGNGKAIFSATESISGQELWITDGTTVGTTLLKDINAGIVDSSPAGFTALGNGKAIFSAIDASHGTELWITDGTSAGTKLVKDIYSGAVDSSPAGFTALGNGKAIFTALEDINGQELWITDGTTAGTSLLKDINIGAFDSYATGFTLLGNGKAIFSANDGINGQELWITDGTAAGTALLKDINAGAVDSSPADFSALGNGKAIFSANDGINGTELWITDGTTQGTQLLKDVNTATLSSNSSGFTKLLVNTLPTAANHLIATKVNVDHVFSLSEFAYSDQENEPLDHLVITSLPTVGTLYLDSNGNQAIDSGEVLAANTTVIATDISHLSFKPDIGATGTPYANFGFKVNDGIADSALAYAMTVNVYNEQMVPGMTSGVIGDGNGDGVADITQANVESLQAIVQTDQANPVVIWATFAAPVDAVISNAKADASPAILPANAKMPLGVFNFDVNGIAVGASKAMSAYLTGNWQVQANGDWLDLSSNSVVNGYWLQTTIGTWHNAATQMVSDGGKLRIDFTLTDGDPISDADGLANGVIVDAGAPGNFTSMASVSTLGNAPLQISRANPNAWSNAWTAIDASISHKADIISGVETWSNVSLNSLASTTLVGGDLYAGDLGVSGQSLATSSVRQEIDGSEALRFNFTHLVTDASVTLSRLFAQDDGLIGNNEAGRLQAYNGTTLVADQVFQGDSSDGQKLIMLDVIQGFDSLVFTAGAFDSQNQFISGGYRNDAGQFATAPFSDTSLHGSDYLIHTLLIGVKPAEFPL